MKLFFAVFFLCTNSFANISITSVTNASKVNMDKFGVEIIAGTSGLENCTGSHSTINSCEINAHRGACNFRTVCPSTLLNLTVSSKNSGDLVLLDVDNNVVKDFGSLSAKQSKSIEMEWKEICEKVTGNSDCEETDSESLKLALRSNNSVGDWINVRFQISRMADTDALSLADIDGVENYTLSSGKKTADLTELSVVQDYAVYGSAQIVGLRGFFAPTDCSTPLHVTTASDSVYMPLKQTKIMDKRIKGLTSGTRYLFMFGFEDEAGNIGLFKDLTKDCVDDKHSVEPR